MKKKARKYFKNPWLDLDITGLGENILIKIFI